MNDVAPLRGGREEEPAYCRPPESRHRRLSDIIGKTAHTFADLRGLSFLKNKYKHLQI
jgi:hypothetical protein